jgi:hypothetical protein
MSIKQNGGVFGRNPTFNDVTIEGDLIINGEVFTGLDFQGSWNANTNSPTLASSVGTNGEFYIVSIAGTTDLNGITNWGIGDWAIFNGTAWQRVEGGADGNFNDVTVAGTLGVTGEITANGGIALGDNDKATFGASDDLQIYHNGSHSFIKDVGTGNLYIDATSLYVRSATGEPYIVGTADAGVSIYHDNDPKIATTATGIDVTGSVVADKATIGSGSGALINAAADDLVVDNGGSGGITVASGATQYGNLFFSDSGSSVAGYIQYLHGTDYLRFGTAATERLRISDNGDINFYEDTGTTVKLFWDASLESLMLNASTRVGTEILTVNGTVTTGGGTASGPALAFRADSNTGIFRPASQALGFSTAGTERLRIDASGHAIIPEGVTLGTAAGVYSAANTLDDYEEGNWTPVQSTASAQTGTWSTLSGTYTKVGDLVTALMHISGTSMGFTSLTGYLKVTGLPFTSSSGPEGQGVWSSLSVSTGLSGSAYAHAGGSFLWMISPSNTNVTSTLTLIVSYKTA